MTNAGTGNSVSGFEQRSLLTPLHRAEQETTNGGEGITAAAIFAVVVTAVSGAVSGIVTHWPEIEDGWDSVPPNP